MKRHLLVFVSGAPMDYSEEFGYTVMLNHTETPESYVILTSQWLTM